MEQNNNLYCSVCNKDVSNKWIRFYHIWITWCVNPGGENRKIWMYKLLWEVIHLDKKI